MSIVNGSESVQSEVSSSSVETNHPPSISESECSEVSSVATSQLDVVSSQCSSTDDEDEEADEDISCFRMQKLDENCWDSDIDAINFQVNRDISMSSALIYRPFDSEEEDSYEFKIFNTKSGKMILEQSVIGLEETDQPQVGILKFENPLRIDSNRTYTAVLETQLKKSIGGREGLSVICCSADEAKRSLVVFFTQPTKDDLGE